MKFSQNYDMIVFNIFVQLTVSYDYRMYTHIHTSGLCRTPRGRNLEPHDHSHRRLIRPMENFYQGIYLLGFACLLACLIACLLPSVLTVCIRHSPSYPQLPKCNNHLVSFIKVYGLFVPYIVDIFNH